MWLRSKESVSAGDLGEGGGDKAEIKWPVVHEYLGMRTRWSDMDIYLGYFFVRSHEYLT